MLQVRSFYPALRIGRDNETIRRTPNASASAIGDLWSLVLQSHIPHSASPICPTGHQSLILLPNCLCLYRITPPPADRPAGLTLKSRGGPCLSLASWAALPLPASARLNVANLGENGFGSFCQNKRASAAGARPGNIEHHVDTKAGEASAIRSPASAFLPANPKMDSRYPS